MIPSDRDPMSIEGVDDSSGVAATDILAHDNGRHPGLSTDPDRTMVPFR